MPTGAADLNTLDLPALFARLAATGLVERAIALARDEDLGPDRGEEVGGRTRHPVPGDITTAACVEPSATATAALVVRAGGVVAGLAALPMLFRAFAPGVRASLNAHDGEPVPAMTTVATLEGPLDEILELERTMLNLVGRLSGIATRTRRFVERMRADAPGARANLYDTRKTTPGLRVLEKYAVRCGGGMCHRIGLYDAVLIKDNHLAGVVVGDLAGFVAGAASRARRLSRIPPSFIEVEVDSLAQFEALLTLPKGTIDIVLLDNMDAATLRRAAARRDAAAPWLALEASGGVTLETVGALAATGVERISAGTLTHGASSLDVALDITPGAAVRPGWNGP